MRVIAITFGTALLAVFLSPLLLDVLAAARARDVYGVLPASDAARQDCRAFRRQLGAGEAVPDTVGRDRFCRSLGF